MTTFLICLASLLLFISPKQADTQITVKYFEDHTVVFGKHLSQYEEAQFTIFAFNSTFSASCRKDGYGYCFLQFNDSRKAKRGNISYYRYKIEEQTIFVCDADGNTIFRAKILNNKLYLYQKDQIYLVFDDFAE